VAVPQKIILFKLLAFTIELVSIRIFFHFFLVIRGHGKIPDSAKSIHADNRLKGLKHPPAPQLVEGVRGRLGKNVRQVTGRKEAVRTCQYLLAVPQVLKAKAFRFRNGLRVHKRKDRLLRLIQRSLEKKSINSVFPESFGYTVIVAMAPNKTNEHTKPP
jgi:hypothetical protein